MWASQWLHVWLQVWNCTYVSGAKMQSCQKLADPTLYYPRVMCMALRNNPWSEMFPFLKLCSRPHLGLRQHPSNVKVTVQITCTRGVFVSQSTKYLWSEYCWLEQSRWLSNYSILLLAPWYKPQLWIDNFCMHGNQKCIGQCFRFSNTDIWCLISKNVISPNC